MMLHVMEKNRRVIATVQLSEKAADAMDFLHAEPWLPKKAVLEALTFWAASQNDIIRGEGLQTSPKSTRADVARLMLERMANPSGDAGHGGSPAREVRAAAERAADPAARVALSPQPVGRREGGAAG